MNFSQALELIKHGHLLKRSGWNGKDQFVFLVKGSHFKVNREPLLGIFDEGTEIDYRSHIDMKYQDGSVGVWLASMGDLMAEDWEWLNGPDQVLIPDYDSQRGISVPVDTNPPRE